MDIDTATQQSELNIEKVRSDMLARTLRRLMEVIPQDVLVDNEDEVNEAWADAKFALRLHDDAAATQQREPQPSVDETDVDDLGICLFIEKREHVAKEWGFKKGDRLSELFLEGIDAEANKRIREELVRLRLQVSAPVKQTKPSLEDVAKCKPMDEIPEGFVDHPAYIAGRLAGLEEAARLLESDLCTATQVAAISAIRTLKESQR